MKWIEEAKPRSLPFSYGRCKMKKIFNVVKWLTGANLAFLLYMFLFAKGRNVRLQQLNMTQKENRTLTIFFISDIHRRKIDKTLLRRVRRHGEIDLVVIGGDLAEKGVPLNRIQKNVSKLSSLGPACFIWGNNDREVGETHLREILSSSNVKILDNEGVAIDGHSDWCICGTDDPSSKNVDVEASIQLSKQFPYTIVATHTPSLVRKVEEYVKPQLMLSGHTHGGQIRFGKFGLHEVGRFCDLGGRANLISNGYGTSLLPLRFGAAPECHVIKIHY